ncbi:2-hydroxymuconate semialdehyde hydrolase [Bacillus rhizoplanae]|uniref:2-hydroxymuconate semialdehyde hydrolase n=1 Tax=Bacillus rhizoplanae TaxID=2880966 RepID=A0ABM8Y6P6_9BACI|nr:alpha/beta fold hydrolase [Bacillus rhizoplanae]CAG9611370.1 2-hydroxymuconate semialdehyde hydrolase [Bacillus rhizoplanae]
MWKQQLIHTERGTFELFTKGHGEPLCVTHLYSQFNKTGDYFADSFTSSHQVILINLKDAGHSVIACKEEELSMEETVEDLEAIREALHISTWHFAGHSTGGMLGIFYAVHHPQSLQSLVIVGASASDYTKTKDCIYHPDHPQFAYMQQLIEDLKLPHLTKEERNALSVKRAKLSLYHPEQYETYFSKPIHKTMAASRMNYFSKEFRSFDLREHLSSVTTKTLILCGKHDVQCPIASSLQIHQGIRNSSFISFEHSNHYPFLEEQEKFSSVTTAFYHSLKEESGQV